MGVIGNLVAPHITQENPFSINLSFTKVGNAVAVSGLEESEINASLVGGSIVAGSFVSKDGNKTFSFQVVPDANASVVKLEVSSGVASYGSEPILAINRTIGVVPDVLAKNELTNWWWYNEALGQVASDSVGSNHGQLIGLSLIHI